MNSSRKQKQPAIGLETLSEIALTESEQLKIATKRSRIQSHSSHASGSGDEVDILSKVPDEKVHKKTCTDEGAGDKPEVPDVHEHHSTSEEESWTFSDGDDDDEDDDANKDSDANDDTELDDDGDNITHPKLSTFITDDQEEKNDEEEQAKDDKDEEEISNQLVRTPSDYQPSDESEKQNNDDTVKDGEEDKEGDQTNVNLEGGDVDMTEADTTKETEDAHMTPLSNSKAHPFNVPISVATETLVIPLTIPLPPFPVTQLSQQTPVTTTTITNPSTTPPLIPDFASLFNFDQRLTALESDPSKLKQSNPFAKAISSIPGIVDEYLHSKMKEAKLIKEQVKSQTSKIKSKVEKYVTESLGAEVLIRSTNPPQTSYRIASSLSELELKKILMDKMEENKSIDRSEVQKNLYKALVEAYNTNKDLLSTYGDVIIFPRSSDDKDKDEEPSTRSDRGTKRRRSGKEAKSSKEPTRKESRTTSSSKGASRSQPTDLNETSHQEFITSDDDVIPTREVQDERTSKSVAELDYHLEEVYKATNEQLDWNNPEGTPYPHNLSKPLPLIPNAQGRLDIPFEHFINNDLEYLKGGSSSRKYTTSIIKTKVANYGQVKWIEDQIPRTTWSVDVYSRHRIIAVISLKIMKFFSYSHLEEITDLRQDDALYKFREGDFKRLRRQDIEDMLLLLVQGKLTNLSLDERYVLNVALRIPDTTRPNLKKLTPYTGYPDEQGIIYQDDLSKNWLMRTDELHKFSDGTLNHVRTTLNDIATGLQMDYLLKRQWSQQDKKRARVMISSIDRKLRDRRLMRSLEKFVGG
ncbi:hypothetical protein Tco_1227800 [Tanacetum coccineum]